MSAPPDGNNDGPTAGTASSRESSSLCGTLCGVDGAVVEQMALSYNELLQLSALDDEGPRAPVNSAVSVVEDARQNPHHATARTEDHPHPAAEKGTAPSRESSVCGTLCGVDGAVVEQMALSYHELLQLAALDDEGPRAPVNSAVSVAEDVRQTLHYDTARTEDQPNPAAAKGEGVTTEGSCREAGSDHERQGFFRGMPTPLVALVSVLLVVIAATFAFALYYFRDEISNWWAVKPVKLRAATIGAQFPPNHTDVSG